MARGDGQRVPGVVRRKAVRTLQSLLAAGIEDGEACEQVAERFNVSARTALTWLRRAYEDLSKGVNVPRPELLGLALKRRRIAMARAAKEGDWKTYLAAADSEAKLLGLNAPVQTEHHVVLSKVQDMSRAMIDVVRDFFADDPAGQQRFVQMLSARVNARLIARPEKATIVIDEPTTVDEPAPSDAARESLPTPSEQPPADASRPASEASHDER